MIYLNLRKILYFKKLCSFTCLFTKKLLFTLELKIENFGIHGNSNPKHCKVSKKIF